MIGILFPCFRIFYSDCAKRIIEAISRIDQIRCALPRAEGNIVNALDLDYSRIDVKVYWQSPSACLADLAKDVSLVILVTKGRTERSGLLFAKIIIEHSDINVPCIQLECNKQVFVEWIPLINNDILKSIEVLDFKRIPIPRFRESFWHKDGRDFRKIRAVSINDSLIIEGLKIGKVVEDNVVLICEGGYIKEIKGVDINKQGFQELPGIGKIDICKVKIHSKPIT